MQSEKLDLLAAALVKAQTTMRGALKDAKNPFFHSNYADLESVWGACREPLTQNGLAVIQTMEVTPEGNALKTTLVHVSGQWIAGTMLLNAVELDPQAQGSAITYARRYALAAMVGVIQVDDDAEGAMERTQGEVPMQPQRPAPHVSPGPQWGMPAQGAMGSGHTPPVHSCEVCGQILKLSKGGTSYYCPNFNDKSRGDHTRITAAKAG